MPFLLTLFFAATTSFANPNATCQAALTPRQLDPAKSFAAMVDWIHQEIILKRGAPGIVVGLSGTDSILVFLASVEAFARGGRPDRVAGIHFAKAGELDWFQTDVLPWLRTQAPGAQILIDESINPKRDGLRWGALMEWSVVDDPETGALRPTRERYWLGGTRNATEDALKTYSNMSATASFQPLIRTYKSEVLHICEHLDVPKIARQKSCEEDCVCGRDQIAAANIPEIDALLMVRAGTLAESYLDATIPPDLKSGLSAYIEARLQENDFKDKIPHRPPPEVIALAGPLLLSHDPKTLARQLPDVIGGRRAFLAAEFVSREYEEGFLPEALALFNTPGLTISQTRMMLRRIFARDDFPFAQAKQVSSLSARLGYYGFSFPQWRFLSQRYAGKPSLAEQFGMARLTRPNDVRDPALPPSDPRRDEWGPGLALAEGDWYVEYRRAYILVANKNGATLVIRNNSYFFGRDRLPQPVYVTTEKLPTERLREFTLADLNAFTPWQNTPTESMKAVAANLNYLDQFNLKMDAWLRANAKLAEFQNQSQVKTFLREVRGNEPSWWPRSTGDRQVLMSGADGDFP